MSMCMMNGEIIGSSSSDQAMIVESEKDTIIDFLTNNNEIFFKSQQRGESDLTKTEKSQIALDVFERSKLNFLIRFGKYLKHNQLVYFQQFISDTEEGAEINLVLKDLQRILSENAHHVDVKNRRYEALKHMIDEGSYFSEIEMMKRNPLLYEHLVGQYLTEGERKDRDKYKMDDQVTFVKILMEGIERDNAEIVRKKQEDMEDEMMEEDDSDAETTGSSSPEPCTSQWGEFEENKRTRPKPKRKIATLTVDERNILKEEFISTMYQNFLDGKDEDFNYDSVDNNDSYDNINEIDHDEEDKYFDSEEPKNVETAENSVESSEDELDIYMSALNQHPAVLHLSEEIKKL